MRRKTRQSLDDGRQLGDGAVGVNEEGQRILHTAECRDGLHQTTEGDLACIVARRRHDERKDDGELPVAVHIEVQQLRPPHQPPVVFNDIGKALLEPLCLCHLAAIERDALTVLPHAHHAETEIRLVALLIEIQSDEFSPNQMDEDAANARIEEGQPEHIAVDGECLTPDGDSERP